MKTKIINFNDVKECPTHNLSPNHWIPEHKTEECDKIKQEKLQKFESKQRKNRIARHKELDEKIKNERKEYAEGLRNS